MSAPVEYIIPSRKNMSPDASPVLPLSMAASSARPIMASQPPSNTPVCRRAFLQLRFRSVSIISGNFESRFKQCDESEMNGVGQERLCNGSLIKNRPEKPALVESGQQALTVAFKGAVTMRQGDPTPLSRAGDAHFGRRQ